MEVFQNKKIYCFYFLFYKIDIPCKNYHCNKLIDKLWNIAIKIYDFILYDVLVYANVMN